MTVEVIISCSVAVYAVVNTVFRPEVRNVRNIALQRDVEPCPSALILRDFLDVGTNERVASRYFYEVPIVRALFWTALSLASLVLLSSAITAVAVPVVDGRYTVPEWAMRGQYFSVVMSLVSSLACGVLAGRGVNGA